MADRLAELERSYAADPTDLALLEALLRARRRAGAPDLSPKVEAALGLLALKSQRQGGLEAVRSLGLVAVPALCRALSSGQRTLRIQAMEALAELRAQSAPACAKLTAVLASEADGIERRAAARALGFIGPAARGALGPLLDGLRSRDWELRGLCAEALGNLGPAALAARDLLAQVRDGDEDEDVRIAARLALDRITSSPERLSELLAGLSDDDVMVRESALDRLEGMRNIGAAAAALRSVLERGRLDLDFDKRCFKLLARCSSDDAFEILEAQRRPDLGLIALALAADSDKERYARLLADLVANRAGYWLRESKLLPLVEELGEARAVFDAVLRRHLVDNPRARGARIFFSAVGRETEAVAAALISELRRDQGGARDLADELRAVARRQPGAISVSAVTALVADRSGRVRDLLLQALAAVDSDESWRAVFDFARGARVDLRRDAARCIRDHMRREAALARAEDLKRLFREVEEARGPLRTLFKRRVAALLGEASEPEAPAE